MKGVPEVDAALLLPPTNFFLLGFWSFSGSPHHLKACGREEKREGGVSHSALPTRHGVSPPVGQP